MSLHTRHTLRGLLKIDDLSTAPIASLHSWRSIAAAGMCVVLGGAGLFWLFSVDWAISCGFAVAALALAPGGPIALFGAMVASAIRRSMDPLKRPGQLVHFGTFLSILIFVSVGAFVAAAPFIGGSYRGVCDSFWW